MSVKLYDLDENAEDAPRFVVDAYDHNLVVARLAEAERDAARYRWLRRAAGWSIRQWLGLTGVWTEYLSGKSLDVSIDEAMRAADKEGA